MHDPSTAKLSLETVYSKAEKVRYIMKLLVIFQEFGNWIGKYRTAKLNYKFNKANKFIFLRRKTSYLVRGEHNYYSDPGEAKSVCKKMTKNFMYRTKSPVQWK